MTEVMSKFASDIMKQKYSHLNKEEEVETWDNIAYRVSKHVLKAVHAPASQVEKTRKIISHEEILARWTLLSGDLDACFTRSTIAFCFEPRTAREGWANLM